MLIIFTLAPLLIKKFMSTEFISQFFLERLFTSVLGVTLFANSLPDSDALKLIQYMPSGFFLSTKFIFFLERHFEIK